MAESFVHAGMWQLLAKSEAAYGTDPVPVPGTDAIMCLDGLKMNPVGAVEDKKLVRETYSAGGMSLQSVRYDLEIPVPLAGPPSPGAGAVNAEVRTLLKAAGFLETGSGGPPVTRYTYTPQSRVVTGQSCYIYLYRFGDFAAGNAEILKAAGCVFSCKLTQPKGGAAFWTFTGKGLFVPNSNAAVPVASTHIHDYDSVPSRSWTIAIDGRSDQIDSFEIDFGVEVVERPDVDEAYGYKGFALKRKTPVITLSPEFRYTSTYDRLTKALAETLFAVSLTGTTVQGGEWVIAASEAQWDMHSYEEGDVVKAPTKLYCRDTAAGTGDNSITIYFERA